MTYRKVEAVREIDIGRSIDPPVDLRTDNGCESYETKL